MARRLNLHKQAEYIDADFLLRLHTFPLHSDGGPYNYREGNIDSGGWRGVGIELAATPTSQAIGFLAFGAASNANSPASLAQVPVSVRRHCSALETASDLPLIPASGAESASVKCIPNMPAFAGPETL
jgi:hypothetical protein